MLSQWQVDSFSRASWTRFRQSLPEGQLTLLLPAKETWCISCTLRQIPPGHSSPAEWSPTSFPWTDKWYCHSQGIARNVYTLHPCEEYQGKANIPEFLYLLLLQLPTQQAKQAVVAAMKEKVWGSERSRRWKTAISFSLHSGPVLKYHPSSDFSTKVRSYGASRLHSPNIALTFPFLPRHIQAHS